MKGQAFIGLPSEEAAIRAVEETNGYTLHSRPMVVVSGHVVRVLFDVSFHLVLLNIGSLQLKPVFFSPYSISFSNLHIP